MRRVGLSTLAVVLLALGGCAKDAGGSGEPSFADQPYAVALALRGAALNEREDARELRFLRRERHQLSKKLRLSEARVSRLQSRLYEKRQAELCRDPSSLVQFGVCLQREGFRVGEHPAFGGVAPVHHGICHYAGKAIDVNYGPSGSSYTESAALDRLAVRLREMPEVWFLWRTEGHWSHIHIAWGCIG